MQVLLYEMKRIDEVKNLWNEMQEKGVEPASVCMYDDIIIGLRMKGYVATGVYWLAYMVKNMLIPRNYGNKLLKI
jgi:pentatricopeptide repeat protein